MNLNIKTTNTELDAESRDYLEKKLASLKKIIDFDAPNVFAQVALAKTTEHHRAGNVFKAEINARMNGHEFHVISEKDDLHAAIDDLKDELLCEVKRFKEKGRTDVKRGGAEVKNALRANKGL